MLENACERPPTSLAACISKEAGSGGVRWADLLHPGDCPDHTQAGFQRAKWLDMLRF